MTDKIQLIEGRVENASYQLEMQERQQADNVNRQMYREIAQSLKFRRITDTINNQQQIIIDQMAINMMPPNKNFNKSIPSKNEHQQ